MLLGDLESAPYINIICSGNKELVRPSDKLILEQLVGVVPVKSEIAAITSREYVGRTIILPRYYKRAP